MKRRLAVFTLVSFSLAGCFDTANEAIDKTKQAVDSAKQVVQDAEQQLATIDSFQFDQVLQNVGQYTANHQAALSLMSQLAGGDGCEEVLIDGNKATITYNADQLVSGVWTDQQTLEADLLFNAIYLTLLMPNVTTYEFNVADVTWVVQRPDVVNLLNEQVGKLPTVAELVNASSLQQFLQSEQRTIEQLVNSPKVVDDFFQQVPLIQ